MPIYPQERLMVINTKRNPEELLYQFCDHDLNEVPFPDMKHSFFVRLSFLIEVRPFSFAVTSPATLKYLCVFSRNLSGYI